MIGTNQSLFAQAKRFHNAGIVRDQADDEQIECDSSSDLTEAEPHWQTNDPANGESDVGP